jgi:hypothetical protein|tara:strand:+ start:250 stop:591 length:342 start_codon:yes stop_codon:yes gene_type:complete
MKTLPKYFQQNDDTVAAYQIKDLDKLRPVFLEAKDIWYDEWVRQGSTDEGSCCGGKGIQVWAALPRKRSAKPGTIINSPPCQGNVSAFSSVGPALKFLADHGVAAEYYDGWVD